MRKGISRRCLALLLGVQLTMGVQADTPLSFAKSTIESMDVTIKETVVNDVWYDVHLAKYQTIDMSEDGVLVKFTLDNPSKVRFGVLTNDCQILDLGEMELETGYVVGTVYQDSNRIKTIGDSFRVDLDDNGEFTDSIYYMEAGTYYLQLGDLDSDRRDYTGSLDVCVLAETLNSYNKIPISSMQEPNKLKYNTWVEDSCTSNGLYDYYQTVLEHPAYLTFHYASENSANIEIYNEYGEELLSLSRSEDNTVVKYYAYLTAGTYIIKMGNRYPAGNTRLMVERSWHYTSLKEQVVKGVDYVKITTIEPRQILTMAVVKGKAEDSSSDLWDNPTQLSITAKKFRPLSNGWYSIRVRDKDGNTMYDTVKVSKVDNKPPARPKITFIKGKVLEGKNEAYSSLTLIIDGRKYKKKCNKKGVFSFVLKKQVKKGTNYVIMATDRSGNSKKYSYKV